MYCYGWEESQYTPEAHHSSCQWRKLYAAHTPDKIIQSFFIVNRCILTCLIENVVHRGFSDKLTPEVQNEICKNQETLGRHEWKRAGISSTYCSCHFPK